MVIASTPLPTRYIDEDHRTVGDMFDPKILKRIAKELLKYDVQD